ncbi:MAG: DUF2075 domain-containing protein [Actinomycetota bacterium]|nr:DUF2075 domain-containing protein [Actinomycetota bacterium]
MTELYCGPTTDFLDEVTHNRMAETLRRAWFDDRGFDPSPSEVRSWRNSLKALANAVRVAALTDHGILLEYQLPLSSLRIDALITGTDQDGRPGAVIVELKQWDDAAASRVPECVVVDYGGKLRDVLHPSAQAGQYRMYLADTHTAFHDGAVQLAACAFLHDFIHDDGSELLSARHANLLGVHPLFAGDRLTDLVVFLDDRLGAGGGMPVMQQVRNGTYRPHKKLLAHTAAMVRAEPTFVLLDEQRVVFNAIVAKVAECVELDQRAAFIIRGGPGTGKSVLALNLVAELSGHGYVAHHATGSAAFTNTIRQIVGVRASQQFRFFNSYLNAAPGSIDVLLCDEAHRIRIHSWDRWTKRRADDPDRPQIDELLTVAKVAVFFIDDLQAVRGGEIGNSDEIEALAKEMGADVYEERLSVQFRCGGSDGFVRWVEHTLGIRRTANQLWAGDPNFDFDVADTVEELEVTVRAHAAAGRSARLVAGYCWRWSDPDDQGQLPADVEIAGWAMPWNAKPDKTRLAPGIPKSHLWACEEGGLDQVGCIYTAQGFEFDHVGVIWGRDLVYRGRRGWVGQPGHSHDRAVKRGVSPERFTELVKNTYRVLLSRGLQGCTVHFLDDETRDFVLSRIDTFSMHVLAAAEEAGPYGAEGFPKSIC